MTVAINKLQGDGYPDSALPDGIGRAATVLTLPEDELTMKLAAPVNLSPAADGETIVRAADEALFAWPVIESVETTCDWLDTEPSGTGRGCGYGCAPTRLKSARGPGKRCTIPSAATLLRAEQVFSQ